MQVKIRQLMDYAELTSTQFADRIEVPRAVISHIISGRNKPSLDVIIKIAAAFPEVNKDWLLLDIGEMLTSLVRDSHSFEGNENNIDSNPNTKHEDDLELSSVGEIQNNPEPISQVVPPLGTDKSIEQIIIFYTDKSFVVYKP